MHVITIVNANSDNSCSFASFEIDLLSNLILIHATITVALMKTEHTLNVICNSSLVSIAELLLNTTVTLQTCAIIKYETQIESCR